MYRSSKGKYQKNNQIDWVEYFEDLIGVTKNTGARVENVTIHFFCKTGKYIESKPLHGSQQSKWIDENILEVKLQLIMNYELERLILSYADSVKVVKPGQLKDSVKHRLLEAVNRYQP